MSYATKQDLIERGWERKLIQLTDRVNRPATTIDDTTVARHLADAASVADSFLVKAYSLPLQTVPASLVKVTADIAMYYLHGDTVEKDSAIDRAHSDALSWLQQVARGLVVIEDAGVIPSAAGGGRVQSKGADRVFSRDSLKGM